MRTSLGVLLACTALLAVPIGPARASGETLTVSPSSGPAGTVISMTYSMNGGCGQREVAEFFFDATPVGRAPVHQQSCRAVLRYPVPASSCTSHPLTAAWHHTRSEQLYGLATTQFTVTRQGSACATATSPAPRQRTAAPPPRSTPAATVAPPRRRQPSRPPVVPVVTSPPPTAAQVPASQAQDAGSGLAIRLAVGLAALGLVVVLAIRLLARRG